MQLLKKQVVLQLERKEFDLYFIIYYFNFINKNIININLFSFFIFIFFLKFILLHLWFFLIISLNLAKLLLIGENIFWSFSGLNICSYTIFIEFRVRYFIIHKCSISSQRFTFVEVQITLICCFLTLHWLFCIILFRIGLLFLYFLLITSFFIH
jgi:hypothetical protein